ncbi:Thioredoxin-like fold,SH3-binding, glutamic acid-rich protein [Cinara cedri]|uniref:Thioredoxin-like fold,SH3-binding, glutamic acid-rich protein n=1 Tax=Cinara cedri TaxID=506608 RepID=A0A5E4M917_9HEMI|nr:Thioredoxin-like fold,SH3-binding, glutamic acid-rich protein [Cinara cedri]
MVVKVYISGISGNKEVKKRQQRVTMILDSKSISYDLVDITEPGKEDEKMYMQTNSKTKDGSKNALPPQIFNNEIYCGDYDDFDTANELDELDKFFDISTKNPPKELNGSITVEDIKVENINGDNDSNDGVIKENVIQDQQEILTSDEDSDNESLDTQNKLNGSTESPNSVPHPEDANVLLDIPETKKELLSENEEEIEE